MSNFRDLTGKRFGRLTVIERDENRGKSVQWRCKCYCGLEKTARARNLMKGRTRSCGCLRKEEARTRFTTHGGKYDKLMKVRASMIARCHNPKDSGYENYGGRGIIVCDRWKESFQNFIEDMGERPEGMSIDRINNDGNYEPGNCRWATPVEQNNNTRCTTKIEYQGVTMPLSYWAKKLKMHVETLRSRLIMWDGNVEMAFERPIKKKK